MGTSEPKRRLEKRIDGAWVECHMKDLRIGDVFRMFDDSDPVIDPAGVTVWEVVDEPAPRADGNLAVMCRDWRDTLPLPIEGSDDE